MPSLLSCQQISELLHCIDHIGCTRLLQFPWSSIAVSNADAVEVVCLCSLHIKAPVTNHDHLCRGCLSLRVQAAQRFLYDFLLFDAGAIQFAADHHIKILFYIKMLQDSLDKDGRLARRHCQTAAAFLERFEQVRHSFINFVFIQSHRLKTLSILGDRLLCCLSIHLIKLLKAVLQRRSDKWFQLFGVRLVDAKMFQCVLYSGGDADLRVGDGSIQIK